MIGSRGELASDPQFSSDEGLALNVDSVAKADMDHNLLLNEVAPRLLGDVHDDWQVIRQAGKRVTQPAHGSGLHLVLELHA
nr:hypothetical protein [Arthrobacter crystallopoietes]